MLPRNQPDGSHVAFDDHRLAADAGLILPVTIAHHLGLSKLMDRHRNCSRLRGRKRFAVEIPCSVAPPQ